MLNLVSFFSRRLTCNSKLLYSNIWEIRYLYTVFLARGITFFLVNRVENQNEPKRPLKWWPFGFVLVFNSAFGRHWH